MSNNKKDLTRIEDLGEFLHDLTKDEPGAEDSTPDFDNSFGDTEEAPAFTEETSSFSSDSNETNQTSSFESSSFESNESSTFETSEFGSDIGDIPESPIEEAKNDFELPDTALMTEETLDTPGFPSEPTAAHTYEPPAEPLRTYEPPAKEYKAPENFEDLKKFAENTSHTGMGVEGNPSFSVLVRNVRFIEDVQDIVSLLRELSLATESEDTLKGRLMRGSLLVPRISEFAAIFLAHKLRRFDVDIQVGLSDEIHPPKHQESPETGLVSKHNLYQNQTHNFHFDDPKLELSQIIVAATPSLEGHQVLRYLGVASEHKMLDGHLVEDEDSKEVPQHYSELAQKLKAHALKVNANAVVGLNYQLTPLPADLGVTSSKYRLTCTGNLVWVNKL